MARRSAPPGSGPAYLSPSFGGAPPRGRLNDANPNESGLTRFVREQVFAPQHLPGNINILTSVALFAGGVFALRNWGDILTAGI